MPDDPNTIPKSELLEVWRKIMQEGGYPADRIEDMVRVGYLAGGMAAETAKHQVRGNIRLLPGMNERWPAYRIGLQIAHIRLAEEGIVAEALDPSRRKLQPSANLNQTAANEKLRRALEAIALGHNDPRMLAAETLAKL